MDCQVCGATMRTDVMDLTYRCEVCGFLSSRFPIEINRVHVINEDAREIALFPLREITFKQILNECSELIAKNGSVLDVGCAHGWFMEAAEATGYQCFGIEPDEDMAKRLQASKVNFVKGYFPDALPAGVKYDVIAFNDVFEHLPNLHSIVKAVRDHLNENGVLIINLPVSDGIFFRISHVLARFGVDGPLSRMWQKGLPSPHQSYFSRTTVPQLLSRYDFDLIHARDLPSVTSNGLYDRIRYDRDLGPLKAVVIFLVASVLVPLTRFLPSDSRYFVFRKA